jgi:hypothetical protein
MTINKVLERIAGVRPLPFDDEVLIEWVVELDAQLIKWAQETFMDAPEMPESYDEDTELFVTHPYTKVYDLYVLAQADAMSKEDDYNNSAALFNQAIDDFKKWYHRINVRKPSKPIINIW